MWEIKKIINFAENKKWGDGYAHLGFHDYFGNQYVLDYDNNWIGRLKGDNLLWTIGHKDNFVSSRHIECELENPTYLTGLPDGSLLVVSSGNKIIYKVHLEENKPEKVEIFIDCNEFGLQDVGNCEYDLNGNVWVNEITGCKIWHFDKDGNFSRLLGDGQPGFQKGEVTFAEVSFNWIYDLRRGPEGDIFVLDSKNYAVRKININNETVESIAGTGKPGYTGDGGDARYAAFGGNQDKKFDGPWSLSLDEEGNIFVGDTQNHVLRLINHKDNKISTLAGNKNIGEKERNKPTEVDLFKLILPLICSLDYYNKNLFIPEWDGDLVILTKT